MSPRVAVVDTNVVVSGLISAEVDSPTRIVLDGMLRGRFAYVVSVELLAEYRQVLLRERVQKRHGLSEAEIDTILVRIAANGIVCEPVAATVGAPDPGDEHLWRLLAAQPDAELVTGDRVLVENPPPGAVVITPREFVEGAEGGGAV